MSNKLYPKKLLNLLLLFLTSITYISAQATASEEITTFESIKTIFQDIKEKEKVVLETDLDSLLLNKKNDQYQAANLMYVATNQEVVNLSIKIKPRGKSRRGLCELPPIKLNFKKSDLANRGLYKAYDKLKLVTHCELDGDMEQLILKEYWTYKLYNEVTPHSFNVKLLEITYKDITDPNRTFNSYAILIENTKEMAHRIGGVNIKQYGTTSAQLTTTSNCNLLVFNYMIGNTDWALHVQRNIKLIRIGEGAALTAIPFDFDQAKLVDAPYLKINKTILAPNAENRYVLGGIEDEQVLKKTIEKFKNLRKNNFNQFKACSYLKRKNKTKMAMYLNTFYQQIKSPKSVMATFKNIDL